MTGDDLLEGITEKSTKADMLDMLNKLADKVRATEKKRTGKLAEIERNVRGKYRPGDVPELHNVIVSSTLEELKGAHEFLSNFEDLLPAPLARIQQGWKMLLEGPEGKS